MLLRTFDKNRIINSLTGFKARNFYARTLKMKELMHAMTNNVLSLDVVDEMGRSIHDQPVHYDDDYIHSIYRVLYDSNKLGIINISLSRIINNESLESAVLTMINNVSPETLNINLFEYDKEEYTFCMTLSRKFPLIGRVKGEVVPNYNFPYTDTTKHFYG
ncbi:hypothetical protein KO361_04725 [Candidatus Woesearchaeota archaeon]|nr:hypothetical protein [Candidatus Woesearchaeota archaeon]